MKIRCAGIMVTLLFYTLLSKAQQSELKNYYIRFKHHEKKVELGVYEEMGLGMKKILSCRTRDLTKELIQQAFAIPADSSELLIYMHCFLGNEKIFHKVTLNGLSKDTYRDSCSRIRQSISIVWRPVLRGYRGNWRKADDKGRRIARVFQSLMDLYNGRMNLLAHSMGNRVLQGIFQEIAIDSSEKQKPVKELVLAAADVEENIFETDFKNAPAFAERIHVFYHTKDRMLRTGAFIIGKQRLGLKGPQLTSEEVAGIKNLYLIDATDAYNWRRFEPSNHIYFYWSPAARKYLSLVFAHQLKLENDKRNVVLEY